MQAGRCQAGIVPSVIVNPGSSRLRARTVAIADPGSLQQYLTPRNSMCLLHGDEGVIGLGEIARFETDSPGAADVWWEAFCTDIENETEMPGVHGTGPLAFGSFAFDGDRSDSRSVMIVPETVIGRRAGVSWLTQLSYDEVHADPPAVQAPPRKPVGPTVSDGVVSAQGWRDRASQVRQILGDDVQQVLLMRDLMARAAEPIDPRWIVKLCADVLPGSWTYLVQGAVGTTSKVVLRQFDGLITARTLTHGPAARADSGPLLEALNGRGPFAELHDRAVRWSEELLRPFCRSIQYCPFPGLVTAASDRMLVTDISGAPLPSTRSLSAVGAIHPAPFVSGLPPWKALETIAEVEGVDRGRVSGPIGWIDSVGDGEWVTDWRGAQIDGTDPNLVHVFVGQPVARDDDVDLLAAELEDRVASTFSLVK